MRNAAKYGLLALGVSATCLLARRFTARRGSWRSFRGRTVLITGASRGLGLILARQLAADGARLALLARSEDDLAAVEDEMHAAGVDALAIPCDVREQSQVEAAIAIAVDHFGSIDVLINNAGVIQVGPFDHMGMQDFADSMSTHFWGPLFAMTEAIPYMRAQGGGRIVNIASIGGKVAVPHLAPYVASKFALVGLSDAMRGELAQDHIAVTTVCPWLMRTGSFYNVEVKGQHDREFAWFAIGDTVPLVSMSAERTAAKILNACRRGSPRLVLAPWGKMAAAANELLPGLIAGMQKFANSVVLPDRSDHRGDIPRTGWQSRSPLVPRVLDRIGLAAAGRNNELPAAMTRAHPDYVTADTRDA